jgi:hypothetical protein
MTLLESYFYKRDALGFWTYFRSLTFAVLED